MRSIGSSHWELGHICGDCFMKTFLQLHAAAVLLSVFSISQAQAQQQTIFCMSDGMQIAAERFETKDGKFLLYVPGNPTPLEYPSSAVKGINLAKCENAIPGGNNPPHIQQTQNQNPPPTGGFGIHGSNTIGERLMPM